ncbi:hypothetical protein ABEX25_00805 [Paenibacillus thiaminolyticus]|uniref:hypothetical protein n=1 Tax=Paenibacillus thiaminolyticus TaxID=49283 RepID=UPI003D26DD3B
MMMSIGQKNGKTRNDFHDKPFEDIYRPKEKTAQTGGLAVEKVQGILWHFIFYVVDLVSQ